MPKILWEKRIAHSPRIAGKPDLFWGVSLEGRDGIIWIVVHRGQIRKYPVLPQNIVEIRSQSCEHS